MLLFLEYKYELRHSKDKERIESPAPKFVVLQLICLYLLILSYDKYIQKKKSP